MSDIKNIKLNGTNFPIGGSGGTGSSGNVFVEVDNLPENPEQNIIYKKSTLPVQLPTPGEFVDTIYFNTTKSPIEIMGILTQDNIFWIDGSHVNAPGFSFCPIICFDGSDQPAFWNDPVVILTFLKNSSDTYYLSFQGFTTSNGLDIWNSNVGWNSASNFVIKKNSVSSLQGLPIGSSNNLLNDILNSNGVFTPKVEYFVWDSVASQWSSPSMLDVPFIPSNALQGAIYRIQNNTPIHSDGYLGSIRFNTRYIPDVIKIFDSITDWIYMDETQTFGMYIIFADALFSNVLVLSKITAEGTDNIYYLQMSLSGESGEVINKVIFSNDTQDYGWKIDSTEVIEINKKGCAFISKETCEQLEIPVSHDIIVGSENDKLQHLILNAPGFYTILSNKIYSLGSQGTQKISIDDSVIVGSNNPVSGGAVHNYVTNNTVQSVTSESINPVSSSAVYSHVASVRTALESIINSSRVTVDRSMSSTSTNPVANYVVKQYVDSKATTITVDSAMSSTSIRPVQNKIIKQYVDDKETELKQYVEDTINNLVERYYS